MVKLTENLVLGKARVDSLENVKNLNLWGNSLSDVSVIQKMPNVEVASLSVNCICTLKDFANCSKLTELYLRKNNISDLSEIAYLKHLRCLKVLWLGGNPCAESENYRLKVVSVLDQLDKLDENDITPDEKMRAALLTDGGLDCIKEPQSQSDKNEESVSAVPPQKAVAMEIAPPSSPRRIVARDDPPVMKQPPLIQLPRVEDDSEEELNEDDHSDDDDDERISGAKGHQFPSNNYHQVQHQQHQQHHQQQHHTSSYHQQQQQQQQQQQVMSQQSKPSQVSNPPRQRLSRHQPPPPTTQSSHLQLPPHGISYAPQQPQQQDLGGHPMHHQHSSHNYYSDHHYPPYHSDMDEYSVPSSHQALQQQYHQQQVPAALHSHRNHRHSNSHQLPHYPNPNYNSMSQSPSFPPNRNNILTAVLSLLQELDPERLRIVRQECDKLALTPYQ